jgi:hypothetical protein
MIPMHPALATFDRSLRTWLLLGLLAVLVLPQARGYSEWIGWLPFWLLAWPAMSLALLHRGRWRRPLARVAAPRRSRRHQARRHKAAVLPRRALLAALRTP